MEYLKCRYSSTVYVRHFQTRQTLSGQCGDRLCVVTYYCFWHSTVIILECSNAQQPNAIKSARPNEYVELATHTHTPKSIFIHSFIHEVEMLSKQLQYKFTQNNLFREFAVDSAAIQCGTDANCMESDNEAKYQRERRAERRCTKVPKRFCYFILFICCDSELGT